MATRTGRVILAKGIKLDNQYKNTIDYTESQMLTLVNSKKVAEFNDCSFVREDKNIITLEIPYGEAIKANYLAFQNPDYTNKWFFGFIDKVEYVSIKTQRIHFTVDELSTWRDYWTAKKCFVVREHVNDDTVGLHTVPEGLETGEYSIVDIRYASMYETETPATDFLPVFCVKKFPNSFERLDNNRIKGDLGYIGGVFSSLNFFAVTSISYAQKIIDAYVSSDVDADNIVNIYMIPACCINTSVSQPSHYFNSSLGLDINLYPLYNYYESSSYKLQQPDVLSGNYHPKNNKLLSWPFSYFFVTNNSGESIDFKYEDFPFETIGSYNRRTMSYTKYLVPSASVSGKLVFDNYKNYSSSASYQTKMMSYGISFGKVPICAWMTDYYTNWLTQNGVNMALEALKTSTTIAAGIGVAALTGGAGIGVAAGIGAVASGANSITSTVQKVNEALLTPPQTHGDVNTGDFVFAFTRNIISFYEMSIRPEFAEIIDNYFTLKGYKINLLKIPNQTGRKYWNYVEIAAGESIGYTTDTISVPTQSMDIINGAYQRGTTIWHNHDNIGNYNLDNIII